MDDGELEFRSELEEWLIDAARRSDLCHERSRPRRIESWRSRTATLHHIRWTDPTIPDMVAKVHHERADAAENFRGMVEMSRQISTDSSARLLAIDPLAYSEDLGVVLMPYIAGEHLSESLIFGERSDAKRNGVTEVVSDCGALLARYHARKETVTEDMRHVATTRLQSRIERVLHRKVDLKSLTASEPIVKSYRDFHPGHILVTPKGKVTVIDPPIEVRHDYFYRDLAFFTHSLFLTLIDPRGLRSDPLRFRRRERLATAFLDSYAESAGRSLTSDDRFFITSWEAFYLARMLQKIRRRRSLSQWAYYYAPVRSRLRRLQRVMERHLAGATP